MKLKLLTSPFLLFFLFCSCKKEDSGDTSLTVYKASGNIVPELDRFRTNLGKLNTSPGSVGGRREINWDGVPDNLLDKDLPDNFFNPVGPNAAVALQRGLAYSGGGFQVSGSRFAGINKDAATEFSAFSGARVFANVSRQAWPVNFQVAGETTPAAVSAFGAVFSDVDLENSTVLEFFDGEQSLGRFYVPAHNASSNHSFLGVQFHNKKITSVQISHQGSLSDGQADVSQGGISDLVVLDDLIYSEPVGHQ